MIEVPWYALLLAILYNDFFTLLGHAGYERFSEKNHSKLKSFSHATTTYHDDHHQFVSGNYALYFTYLDTIFKTRLKPKYEKNNKNTIYYTSSVIQDIWKHLSKEDDLVIIKTTQGKSYTTKQYRESLLHKAQEHQQYRKISGHNTVAIFIRDAVCFSQIVIGSLMNGDRVVLLDPSM